jgi:hypothetical protein
MHYIGAGPKSGQKADTQQGYEVEFFVSGQFHQFRSYAFGDELLMSMRICKWVKDGVLNTAEEPTAVNTCPRRRR